MKTARCTLLTLVLAATGPFGARPAASEDNDLHAARPGVTVGGRASYARPKDADSGSMSGGAQVRFHLTSVIALEGSGDYRQNEYGGTKVDVIPAQASLLLYLAPTWTASPYLLGGVGWYYTHVHGSGRSDNRYGPHAGGGLEVALHRHWSVDASYRYLWTQSLNAPTVASPAGRDFSDNGFMLTGALNYRF
jgi:opacity protein-like surface antigen